MTHWAEQYIGLPWEPGAQGPDAFNCWGLVRHVQLQHFGRELPLIGVDEQDIQAVNAAFSTHAEFSRWQQVGAPVEGDCVISKGAPDKPDHVGIYVEAGGGRILQSVCGAGVIAAPMRAMRMLGWQHIEYWRFAG